MLSEQRMFCLGMVEIEAGHELFPAASGMAILAGFLESALVRIDMARSASTEIHVLKAHRSAGGIGFVAILAGHFAVQSG